MSRERYVIVGIWGIAIAIALPLAHGLAWLLVEMGIYNPSVLGEMLATDLAAYGVSAIAAIVVLNHPQLRALCTEVVDELSKVTWPSRQETGSATVVVIVTVLICAAYLWVFDAVWLKLTDWILGVSPGAS
jgi:preprotein translocase SecE subunit